jgi:hypothetical protein
VCPQQSRRSASSSRRFQQPCNQSKRVNCRVSAKFTRAREHLSSAGTFLPDVETVDRYLHCLRTAPDAFSLPLDQFREQRKAEHALDPLSTSLTLLDIQFRLHEEETRRQSQSTHRQFQGGQYNPSRDRTSPCFRSTQSFNPGRGYRGNRGNQGNRNSASDSTRQTAPAFGSSAMAVEVENIVSTIALIQLQKSVESYVQQRGHFAPRPLHRTHRL